MQYDCKIFDQPNKAVVETTKVTDQYTELRAIETPNYEFGMHDTARLVIFDQDLQNITEHSIMIAVAMASDLSEAMNFVAAHIGLSVEDQKFENSHIDVHGQNGKFLFMYVAQDAPGWSVAYAMNALASGGYDLQDVLDSYFMP